MGTSPQPQPLASAVLQDVVGDPVSDAESALSAFTKVRWQDTNGRKVDPPPTEGAVISEPTNGYQPEEPADQIGKSIPTDTAITITFTSVYSPR
jgi:hypothetical protein